MITWLRPAVAMSILGLLANYEPGQLAAFLLIYYSLHGVAIDYRCLGLRHSFLLVSYAFVYQFHLHCTYRAALELLGKLCSFWWSNVSILFSKHCTLYEFILWFFMSNAGLHPYHNIIEVSRCFAHTSNKTPL